MKKLTTEEFINRAKNIHPDYDYSNTIYINKRTKIKYNCPIHKEQEQFPENHIKYGCKLCGIEKSKNKRKSKNIIEEFIKTHKTKYDYSKVNYINSDTPVEIICSNHGSFWQSPYEHKSGSGCPKCAGKNKTTFDFIKEARLIHNNKYDYSLVNYINAKTLIKIICPNHGVFKQTPNNHLNKHGCPICNESKGEKLISNILTKNNIIFEREKRFNDCKDKNTLPFDFYLPNYNIVIEHNGKQHYSPVDFGSGSSSLELIKKHDKIKKDFCLNNGIDYLEIHYSLSEEKVKKLINEKIDHHFVII